MRTRTLLLAAALLCLWAPARPTPMRAQVTPADSAAVLLDAADRFAAEGQGDVAEALYRYVLERFPGTAAAEAARERLTRVRAFGTQGSGQVELQVWSTLYGLWLGIAVPGAFGADEPEPYGLGLLAGGPAGFLAGRLIAGSRELTQGQARAITLGGTWGTWQGFGWAEVLDDDGDAYSECPAFVDCYESGSGDEEKFAAMIVGGIAGIAAGAVLSRRDVSAGAATTANFGALWGTWLGFGTGVLAEMEDDALLAATLVGGNAGLFAAAALAPSWNVSRSRARLVSLYGLIGGLSGLGLDLLTQPDNDKVAMGIPLAGSIVGLALGVGQTRDYDAVDAPDADVPGGALVNVSDGAWSLGTPLPLPRLLELDGHRGPQRKTAIGFTLLSARF